MDIKHNIIHASDFNMQSVQSRVHSCRLSEIHHSDTKLPLYHFVRTVKNQKDNAAGLIVSEMQAMQYANETLEFVSTMGSVKWFVLVDYSG